MGTKIKLCCKQAQLKSFQTFHPVCASQANQKRKKASIMAKMWLLCSCCFGGSCQRQKLLKDVEKLTEFHHTGALEVFHSMMLKYLPKRNHFSYKSMVTRTQLATLEHNHNCNRKQAVVKSGANKNQQRFKVEKPKANKNWVCKPIN